MDDIIALHTAPRRCCRALRDEFWEKAGYPHLVLRVILEEVERIIHKSAWTKPEALWSKSGERPMIGSGPILRSNARFEISGGPPKSHGETPDRSATGTPTARAHPEE
jgi:hypothetical protein